VEQFSATTEGDGSTQAQEQPQPAPAGAAAERSGFGSRGRLRRRARFLRKARELAYRDLGGLVFNLHRFGQRNDPLVLAKLNMLSQIDDELRGLEAVLNEHEPVTVLREAGITACARCAAIHGSEDRFCPNCGLSLGRHPDLPIAVAGATTPAAAPPGPGQGAAATPTPGAAHAPGPAATPAPAAGTLAASASQAPATAQYPAVAPPAEAQPTPSQPDPATQAFPAVVAADETRERPVGAPVAGRGRAPTPPSRPSPPAEQAAGSDGEDSITEIIRPPAQSP
jgi:hypothetical protein